MSGSGLLLCKLTPERLIANVSGNLLARISGHAPPLSFASCRLPRLGWYKARDSLFSSQHVTEIAQKIVQRCSVLLIGQGGVAVGYHNDAIIEHHGIARRRFAADVGQRASDEQTFDATASQFDVDVGGAVDERAVFDFLDVQVSRQRLQLRIKRKTFRLFVEMREPRH